MKSNKMRVTLGIVIGILVLIGASYLGRSITNRPNKAKEAFNNENVPSDYTIGENTCHNRFNYFVITRPDLSGNSGEDILVKYKTGEAQKFDCKYLKGDNDLELLNTPADDVPLYYYAQHFAYIKDNLLVVDEGTSTNRGFKIYDLNKREKIFSDEYSGESLNLQDGVLTYWHKTTDIPNNLNCAKLDEYKKMGGGAAIEAKISIDISNSKDREFNEFRCSYVE